MLPVALTSPLWWVARWSSRLVTGVAVAVALSLGGSAPSGAVELPSTAPLPVTAAPSQFVPAVTAPAASAAFAGRRAAGAAPTGRADTVAGDLTGYAAAGRDTAGYAAGAHDPVGRPAMPAVADGSARPAGALVAAAATFTGLAPTVTGPRAPPAG
ncbi:hypothetical protein [Micromonospora psammae]|uniref:hypothetical protein n=1 Tax=Micromonospora sp. CPCC 205556 TaxID=3122398 RepID=UPI002FF2CF75